MPSRHTPRPLDFRLAFRVLSIPFLTRGRRPPAAPSTETMPLLPEERGWHIVKAQAGAAVQRELQTPRASYDSNCTPTPGSILIDATWPPRREAGRP